MPQDLSSASMLDREYPPEVLFRLSDQGLEELAVAAQLYKKVSLTGFAEESLADYSGASRFFRFETELLERLGAKIAPGTTRGSWVVSDLDPVIFFPSSPDFTRMMSGFKLQSTLPELDLPMHAETRELYANFKSFVERPLDPVSGWSLLSESETIDRFEELRGRYPNRELFPLLVRSASDDVLCFDLCEKKRLFIVHEFSAPGFENVKTYETSEDFFADVNNKILSVYDAALDSIRQNPRYLQGISWGSPRPGHPEGTVQAHIQELSQNLAAFADSLTPEERVKLEIFIHTHDTFKAEAQKGVSILDPRSHASIARAFVEEHIGISDLSPIIQYHDELFSLWRSEKKEGQLNISRYNKLVESISDWDTFINTKLIDNLTLGKSTEPTVWALRLIEKDERIHLSFDSFERANRILFHRGLEPIER